MIELLNFVFQGPWIFCGSALLLIIVFAGLTDITKAIRGKE